MSALRDLLAAPDRMLGRLRVRSPELRALPRAVEALGGEAGGAAALEDTAAVQGRIMAQVCEGDLSSITRRDLREGCKTLFHPPLAPGRDAAAMGLIVDEVEARRRHAALLALIGAYLDGFDPEDADITALAARLEGLRGAWPWRPHDPWPQRAQRYGLFDPAKAPGRIAEAVIAGEGPAARLLAEAGLDTDGRRRGGLALAAFRAACTQVETSAASKLAARQVRLMDWAWPTGDGRRLELPEAWPELAAAMFAPWHDRMPPGEHQALLSGRAIDYAGDPRVASARWAKVTAPDVLAVLKRWLVRASVLQFFDIVDTVADGRMWLYRRAFWKAYVEAEPQIVDDAWIVFGSAGVSHARAAAERTAEPALRQFGRLEPGPGRSPNHACLLMRIGDLTIAEWSHNGRCYMWPPGTKGAPKLGQTRYYADELAHPQAALDGHSHIGIVHRDPERFGWQTRVAQHIHDFTGLKTLRRDWRP
jgi:hypothetical protein